MIELPTELGQYLFGPETGDLELWRLTANGWYDASGTHYESPQRRNPNLTRWRKAEL